MKINVVGEFYAMSFLVVLKKNLYESSKKIAGPIRAALTEGDQLMSSPPV